MENHIVIGKWMRGFSRLTGDCTIGHLRIPSGTLSDQKDDIVHSCSQMVNQLHGAYDPLKVCSITYLQRVFNISYLSTNPQVSESFFADKSQDQSSFRFGSGYGGY